MTGLKTKRIIWTIVFLGITLAAIVMEVVAGVFHPAGTIPWTEYLAEYVPWPFQLAAYVILAVWLPFHFWRADEKAKRAYRNGRADAIVDIAAARARPILADAHPQDLADELARRGLTITRDANGNVVAERDGG